MRNGLIIVADAPALARRAAAWIAAAIDECVTRRGRCSLALAGGQSPRPVYQHLAGLPWVPWAAVSVYFGDERAVAPDDSESNYRMAVDTLLSQVAVPANQVHRMEAERPDRDAAARDYEARLPDSLDLVLLGMGADGHIASLFPHAPALSEIVHRVVPVLGGTPALSRLTVTPPVLHRAGRLLVMAAGSAKASAVARALEGEVDPIELPARLARGGVWILDRAAAAGLRRSAR